MKKKISVLTMALLLTTNGVLASVVVKDYVGHMNEKAIDKALEEGYMHAYTDGNFKPNAVVNRAQLAQILSDFEFKMNSKYKLDSGNTSIGAISNVMDATVVINDNGFTGAGVLVSEDKILTANHVVDSESGIKVKLNNIKIDLDAKVIKRDEWQDIALIQLTPESVQKLKESGRVVNPVKLFSGEPTLGETVYAFGSPDNLDYTVTRGILSNVDQYAGGRPTYQFDASVHPGNSGGPLVNSKGELIGIVTSVWKSQSTGEVLSGISFATKIEIIRELLNEKG